MPNGKNTKLCIEKWCLLPPYNHRISKKEWKTYYKEQSALDKANMCGYPAKPTLKPEGLCANPWMVLQTALQNIAATIYRSVLDEDEKIAIACTLRRLLYLLELDGKVDNICKDLTLFTIWHWNLN
ncbi:hypothetical protein RhiXN_00122 [Rhizoctonia solani]|uniref:Uncharacterized protein n=1 Tax=Rhizoctonia solani TaxID=456999 RepID=A0A8H8SUA7_9AGAM|nr:uncharacterized protein RhiXN_00122 [Rhizoctonia solani]QRW18716.1 hypothetical protein RhiXN_00122 [Rhizoctonia solani]